MGAYHIPHWLQTTVASSGGIGLFVIAFLDSSFVPFPSVNDLLLMGLSIEAPSRMIYYASMCTAGSVVGCLVLYAIARKGEEAAFHRRAGKRGAAIRHWIERYGFLSMVVAALLPPPTPFKFFVLAAGGLGMGLRPFVGAIIIARAVRFYGEGYFAVRYGHDAMRLLAEHKLAFLLGSVAGVLVFYGVIHLLIDRHEHRAA
jgi:membrane protein YqaA with SNARE-associated domain